MSRICRIISTFLIIIGLGFLCFYTFTQSANNKFAVLDKPSYYVLQNYWYIFLAGIAVLLFSLIGSFCSWFKGIEEKEEILPNAGYSSKKDIAGWVGGTSLDTAKISGESPEKRTTQYDDITEVLMEEDKTEILTKEEQTELLREEDRTEILTEEQAEMHGKETQEEKK